MNGLAYNFCTGSVVQCERNISTHEFLTCRKFVQVYSYVKAEEIRCNNCSKKF